MEIEMGPVCCYNRMYSKHFISCLSASFFVCLCAVAFRFFFVCLFKQGGVSMTHILINIITKGQ